MADALGTPSGVVSAADHRLSIAGMIAASGTTPAARTGVMWGPGSTALITGTSATGTMTVNVLAHHWVTSRATGDGVYLGTKETSTTVNIAAAPGTNSRIDVVYSKENDSASTISPDGSTGELYGVVTGTAAVSPTKPAIPVGAVEIGTVTVAAGATNTAGAGVTIATTAALTVARGAPIPVRNQTERDALTTYAGLTVNRLDTGKWEIRNPGNTAWVTLADPTLAAPSSPAWVDFPVVGSPYLAHDASNGAQATPPSTLSTKVQYRVENFRVFMRGRAYSSAGFGIGGSTGANPALASALPSNVRPTTWPARIWPTRDNGSGGISTIAMEISTAGQLYAAGTAVPAGSYISFDGVSWPLG